MANDFSLLPNDRLVSDYDALAKNCPRGIYLLPPEPNKKEADALRYSTKTLLGLCFVEKGPYRGAIVKFTISVSSAYPLMGAPVVSILSPAKLVHPIITVTSTSTKHEARMKITNWDPSKCDLLSIVLFLKQSLENFVPKMSELVQLKNIVQESIEEALLPDRDIFSPLAPEKVSVANLLKSIVN